jgi:hypothetical protein
MAHLIDFAAERRARRGLVPAPAPRQPLVEIGMRVKIADGRIGVIVSLDDPGYAAVWISPRHVRVPIVELAPAPLPAQPA